MDLSWSNPLPMAECNKEQDCEYDVKGYCRTSNYSEFLNIV